MTDQKNTRQRLADLGIVLGGVKEVAAVCRTNPTNVSTWMSRRHSNGCPEAVSEPGMGSIFDLNEWVAWHQTFTASKPKKLRAEDLVKAKADAAQ